MKLRFVLAALALLLGLAACGDDQPTVREALTTETDTQIKITGTGLGVSEPFRIKLRGIYKLYWKAAKEADAPNDPVGCPIKGEMTSATQGIGFHRNLATEGTESADRPGMMESRPFNLEAQSYSVKVETDCAWELTFERQLSR
jgi:hypothetical protein